MSLSSMTGFARADGEYAGTRWHWEVRSVNGKGLDLRLRLPQGFEALEQTLRTALAERVSRGNCQATLQLDRAGREPQLRINQEALGAVIAAVRALSEHETLAPPTADGVLALKGVLETTEPPQSDEERAGLEQALAESFAEAAAARRAARDQEGIKVEAVVSAQIDRIGTLAQDAERAAAAQPDVIRARLKAQLDELMAAQSALPEERIAQEAALLATKQDVREELDRLKAHVAQARELLVSGEPAGRRLDFLTQEFNREANTLCSKAADVELTRIGLELKAVIDQLREQVQNVE